MTDSPLFKRAFVRGLNEELTRQGAVVYPTKEAADRVADYIADNSGMPDPYSAPDKVTTKIASQLCDYLVAASQQVCKEAGGYLPEVTKTAQATDPGSAASTAAWALMEKAAAETGSLMEGGDNQNDMPAAASENAEAAQEQNRRGENYANLGEKGVGNYERKGQGSVGTEEQHPEKPRATDEGSNSVTENSSKHGSLASIVRKVAAEMGSMMTPGQESNDMPAAAKSNAEAAQEQNRRPENYANKGEKGVGRSDMVPGKAEQVGTEQAHPEAPAATDSGKTNVPLEHTKSAFDQLFEATAKQVIPYMPERMDDNTKVAHVRAMMGLDTAERAGYLSDLFVSVGGNQKHASLVKDHFLKAAEHSECPSDAGSEVPMPPALMKKEEKSEKSEEKKEAAAVPLSNLRQALSKLNAH